VNRYFLLVSYSVNRSWSRCLESHQTEHTTSFLRYWFVALASYPSWSSMSLSVLIAASGSMCGLDSGPPTMVNWKVTDLSCWTS
jgi:hypothetical protein